MSIEATSALSFSDLILEVARKMGVAFYGENGDESAQVPVDPHDLEECKRHVNNAVRMFLADAPPTGWRWARPVASVTLWVDLAVAAARTVTGGTPISGRTPIIANSAVFYESMEEKTIIVTGQGSFVIAQYISPTQVTVYGNHAFAVASTYSITGDGNYTLPRTFAGTFTGGISWGPSTNRSIRLEWADESTIRGLRENVNIDTGIPLYCGLSVFLPVEGRRRYQLMLYPAPYQQFTVQFPYELHFDELTSLSSTPPAPIAHDEAIRAACLAVVERDVDDMNEGPAISYYRTVCLPGSLQIDARSGPRKLGYFGNGSPLVTPGNFREYMKRLNVQYNTP